MVAFTRIPYHHAIERANKQDHYLNIFVGLTGAVAVTGAAYLLNRRFHALDYNVGHNANKTTDIFTTICYLIANVLFVKCNTKKYQQSSLIKTYKIQQESGKLLSIYSPLLPCRFVFYCLRFAEILRQDIACGLYQKADEPKKTPITLPKNVEVLKSRAVNSLFTVIRNKNTQNEEYVHYADRLCHILAEEGLARLCDESDVSTIETPCGKWVGPTIINPSSVAIISVMRSGDILLEAVRKICRGAHIGKILIQRNEASSDKSAVHYYTKLPKNLNNYKVILVDPMLATGGSAKSAVSILKKVVCLSIVYVHSILLDKSFFNKETLFDVKL
ncbi:hypothetical protein RFI_16496 [Reticulomyxa filosa]|uniref:Phosphoribosyltransferase domain-containing protein n=1 Tax=Reticulomyxa filosa TaxID=46433 RepID=X6N3S7_RETFI|nr:hypothetical protein RFI_16496 [Reticulomyxa filosa]|eukprot:ETO20721.1 hypothetical protein RFI_16496 [Reticulomyxa filosa]